MISFILLLLWWEYEVVLKRALWAEKSYDSVGLISGNLENYLLPPHLEKVRIYNKYVKMNAKPINFSICIRSLGERVIHHHLG